MRRSSVVAILLAAALAGAARSAPRSMSIIDYIQQTWSVLTRSHRNLALEAADPKFPTPAGGRPRVYVGPKEDVDRIMKQLRSEIGAELDKVDLHRLPTDPLQLHEHGLLYLPHSYVVPGGRFNEMYGWDSYFIQMGLLRDGQLELARNIADNFVYEILQYGKILNANRSYYLTRSQPPFFTDMLLAVFQRTKDQKWLANAIPAIEIYYRYWTTEPHLTQDTGLSRYFDLGEGPAPEVIASEIDANGRNEYELIKEYFRSHDISDYDVGQYYDAKKDQLTALFYKGDRSMRESGFDPSARFGAFSVDIIHYDPVCLNSLLYLMEIRTSEIMGLLGREKDRAAWKERAEERAKRINRLMWDAREGLFFDYDFVRKRTRHYPFLTTFYPLWVGLATQEQAAQVARNLSLFERAGGLETSSHTSGDQWDAPFGWAPLEWIAVEGLRRYGYNQEANRIAKRFLSLIVQEFHKRGTLFEKYDVVDRRIDVTSRIHYGYRSNEAGFGWTNAVFTALFDQLPPVDRREVLAGDRAIYTGQH